MILTTEHFLPGTASNLHIFRETLNSNAVEDRLRQICSEINYDLIVFRGEHFRNEHEAILELATALEMPKNYGLDYRNASWNSIDHFVTELQVQPDTWRTRKSASGYLLLYRDPQHLIKSDALVFATLLNILGTSSLKTANGVLPIHLIVGPMIFRHEYFSGLLRVSDQFCEDCQNVD
ncbi:hypothetical protein [Chondromyces crocatus]|uniref:Barstar (barnase inhibitor) domain-containing protein n=1 Tax=Chondromyces crocatus TaxID=52 RepID=A0A0K1ES11_CHOCO|nr:hypothetical protein [Chondromyces crocatus]AKT43574.1 uncharacterized protein CMC5_078070 [Chondromyces crocatus]